MFRNFIKKCAADIYVVYSSINSVEICYDFNLSSLNHQTVVV